MLGMRIGTLRRGRSQETGPGVAGIARLDRRTKNLTKRLRPGDIAVIDHVDIDRVSADALVGCKVAAVEDGRAEPLAGTADVVSAAEVGPSSGAVRGKAWATPVTCATLVTGR